MEIAAQEGAGTLVLAREPLRMAGAESADPRGQTDRARLDDAAKRFAGLLAQQFVHGMLESADGLVGSGPGKDVLKGLLEDTLAGQVMNQGSLGLEPAILRQISPAVPSLAVAEGPFSLERKTFSLGESGDDASHDD